MKKTVILLLTVSMLSACMKKRWEDPSEPAFWLGKWDIEEIYESNGSTKNTFTDVKGYIKFKKRLKADMYGKGDFKITYSAPNAQMLSHSEVTYEGEFTWRIQGIGPTIVMEEDGIPALGVGREGLAGTSRNIERTKWNYTELSVAVLESGFVGFWHGLILTRK